VGMTGYLTSLVSCKLMILDFLFPLQQVLVCIDYRGEMLTIYFNSSAVYLGEKNTKVCFNYIGVARFCNLCK
jgi:hypothetical protein